MNAYTSCRWVQTLLSDNSKRSDTYHKHSEFALQSHSTTFGQRSQCGSQRAKTSTKIAHLDATTSAKSFSSSSKLQLHNHRVLKVLLCLQYPHTQNTFPLWEVFRSPAFLSEGYKHRGNKRKALCTQEAERQSCYETSIVLKCREALWNIRRTVRDCYICLENVHPGWRATDNYKKRSSPIVKLKKSKFIPFYFELHPR